MRLRHLVVAVLLGLGLTAPASAQAVYTLLGPQWAQGSIALSPANGSLMTIDATTKKLAFKIYVSTASPITSCSVNVTVANANATTWTLKVVADNADLPTGSTLGAATSAFAIAGTGWTGDKSLGSDTGALTVGTAYWVMLEYSSGTLSTMTVQGRTAGNNGLNPMGKIRLYNGTDWTTVTPVTLSDPLVVCTHVDGTVVGMPISAGAAATAVSQLYGNRRHALWFKVGSKVTVAGAVFKVSKTGTPTGALLVTLYSGTSSLASCSIAVALVISGANQCLFASPVEASANASLALVLSQSGDVGDASNNYALRTFTIGSASHLNAMLPASTWRFKYGTGNDPTALSSPASDVEVPYLMPLVLNPVTGFATSTSGGGIVQ